MLKDIRLHLEKDEDKQELLEKKLAEHISVVHKANINSFQRNIPSMLPYIKSPKLQNYALFCNKFNEFNIVDYGIGRTLYGFHPEQEVSSQLEKLKAHCPYVSLNSQFSRKDDSADDITELKSLPAYKELLAQQPLPDEIECLVVLGCGLGLQFLPLLQQHKVKYLIIYEPEHQYFQCSSLAIEWQAIFEAAKVNNTGIFIQLEKDGRDIVENITEIQTHTGITGFHLYQHYNHPVFDSLYKDLTTRSWQDIKNNGIGFHFASHYNEYVPSWTPLTNLTELHQPKTSDLFERNLNAFKKYFPEIYKEYKDYTPKTWLPLENQQQEINLLKKSSLVSWYGDSPKSDCELNYENFNSHPNKDGLVLGYTGTKLAHYLHYQFVKETEKLLKEAEDEVGALPDNVASLIMFGMGVGYQLETLLANHKVEKLFICEPNTDFFYASLYAIDWQKILENVDQSDGRIYLNIGDDGSHLFRDLLNQFYAVGPYILNNTYFYQSYYNASLNSAIAQLREQLQVVISMGEYFDHAYYGINHTKEGLRRGYPALTKKPADKLSYDDKEVPVFIVGNGPSLDFSIEALKEWQDRAIIVSCGTALKVMHHHGIVPDFHAEIEQNRSTFDWPVLIGDLDYLKQITLVSCNGIHPDTCDLYKDVLIAFKEGESSTVSTLSVLGDEHFEILKFAFPTVGNFATNLFTTLGFSNIYFMGVDLGFVDVKHHHSKHSGYYKEDGEELYDYSEKNNTSLIIPGNFRKTVNTKHEFKVAKQVMESAIQHKDKTQQFYNCSDGARIAGAAPLGVENLLITVTPEQKSTVLSHMKTSAFSAKPLENAVERYEDKFSHKLLCNELAKFEELLEQEITTVEEAEAFINRQKELLFISYQYGKSLLFYYLYGTVNYANAALMKLVRSKGGVHQQLPEAFHKAKDMWCNSFYRITDNIKAKNINDFDISKHRINNREWLALEMRCKGNHLLVLVDSEKQERLARYYLNTFAPWLKKYTIEWIDSTHSAPQKYDYVIYFTKSEADSPLIIGKQSTVVTTQIIKNEMLQQPGVTYFVPNICSGLNVVYSEFVRFGTMFHATLSEVRNSIIIPKLVYADSDKLNTQINDELPLNINDYAYVSHSFYVAIYGNQEPVTLLTCGSRAKVINGPVKLKETIYKIEPTDKFQLQIEAQNQLISTAIHEQMT